MRSPNRSAARLFLAVIVVVGVAGAAALAAPPAGSSSAISTQGVVVFGDGTSTANRGTYRMNPDGTGFASLSAQIYPNDVSRGRTPVTVLMDVKQSDGGVDIYAMRADGSRAPVPLLVSSETKVQLRFSPDGDQIAYASVVAGPPVVWSIRTADLVRDAEGDVVGMANIQVAWSGSAQVQGLDWSRDGTMIVCSMANDLVVLHLGDGSLEQLTSTTEIEAYPRWSPVDDRIAFLRRADASTSISSLLTIHYPSGTVTTVLAGGSSQYASWTGGGACWSPGATHLMAVLGGRNKPSDLYQFPSTGGKGVNVTGGVNAQPAVPCWGW